MSRGLNKVLIIGVLGNEPEMRYTPNGKPVTSFSVAVSSRLAYLGRGAQGGDRVVQRRFLGQPG
ncbi:MAG: single-stranded DNA-binding protein [Anaerolineae bacterium]